MNETWKHAGCPRFSPKIDDCLVLVIVPPPEYETPVPPLKPPPTRPDTAKPIFPDGSTAIPSDPPAEPPKASAGQMLAPTFPPTPTVTVPPVMFDMENRGQPARFHIPLFSAPGR